MQADIAIKTAAELSPFALFMQADIVVKAVMFGLLLASVWSWAIILERSRRLSRSNCFGQGTPPLSGPRMKGTPAARQRGAIQLETVGDKGVARWCQKLQQLGRAAA